MGGSPRESATMSSPSAAAAAQQQKTSWKSRFSLTSSSGGRNSNTKEGASPTTVSSKTAASLNDPLKENPDHNNNKTTTTTTTSLAASRRNNSRSKQKGGMRGRLRNFLGGGGNAESKPAKEKSTTKSTTQPSPPELQTVPSQSASLPVFSSSDTDPASSKRALKERDGFCRRVDHYDGQVIVVDGKNTYELGNYLGGGVAGVVYEGHRLRPMEEYPVRGGVIVEDKDQIVADVTALKKQEQDTTSSFLCGDGFLGAEEEVEEEKAPEPPRKAAAATPKVPPPTPMMAMDVAIETTADDDQAVVVEAMDAPSRTKLQLLAKREAAETHPLTDETVAIKILNPVGFRILPADSTQTAVVVREGEPMPKDVQKGKAPMQEQHVWWLINPSSRNLRTLQRTADKVERGTPEKGLRLSMVAAYKDTKTGQLRELPLTRCIEIWGHVPFSASDVEFDQMMEAIERVNAGHVPAPVLLNSSPPPSRVGTDTTSSVSASSQVDEEGPAAGMAAPTPLGQTRTGLYRAAATSRATVYCKELNAYIAVPAVPPKYLRWLKQRRAATKEIRNMMLIGRHKNVVHLYEVLELIQDSKSTMFLILELVRGGELFDLISNSANKDGKNQDEKALDDSEETMRKFFRELACGIYYCHSNGIAHRDLKPENLLVHTESDGHCTLKIADFGLSATFAITNAGATDDMGIESFGSTIEFDRFSSVSSLAKGPTSPGATMPAAPSTPTKPSSPAMNTLAALSATALTLLQCGSMDDILCGANSADDDSPASPLRRMTSIVGSPHYVAPEIISQHDENHSKSRRKKPAGPGYDGTKADVWSAGVILYAMLFRSLPFGEDLLRCPRYQSFLKWYEEARLGRRRSSAAGALNPIISEADARDMLGPHWFFPNDSSRESKDLIVAMLNPNPNDRLSIEQVLQHSWFTAELSSS